MLNVSDHMLIDVTRKKAKAKRKVEYIFKRKITDEKIPLFKSDIANHDWSSLYTLTNTTDMWNGMLKTINHYADIHFPIKKFKKKNNKNSLVWLTLDLQKEIESKNFLLLKAKKSKNKDDIKAAHKKRNYVNNLIKKAKKNYYKTKIEENIKKSKIIWKIINELFPNKNKNSDKIQSFNNDNSTVKDEDLPNHINCFFNTIGKSNLNTKRFTYGPYSKPTFNLRPVFKDKVVELIEKINIKKNSSVPNLSSHLLKEAFLSAPDAITYVINKCILYNDVPSQWKSATIIPLKKQPL